MRSGNMFQVQKYFTVNSSSDKELFLVFSDSGKFKSYNTLMVYILHDCAHLLLSILVRVSVLSDLVCTFYSERTQDQNSGYVH